MDGKKIDIVREAFIAWSRKPVTEEENITSHEPSIFFQGFYSGYVEALSAIDPEAIRRECAEKAVAFVDDNYNAFGEWDRVAFDDLRAAILADEPAQDDGRFKCDVCGNTETTPYSEGDACYCGGHLKPSRDDGKLEVATFDDRNMFKERAAEVKRRLEEVKP